MSPEVWISVTLRSLDCQLGGASRKADLVRKASCESRDGDTSSTARSEPVLGDVSSTTASEIDRGLTHPEYRPTASSPGIQSTRSEFLDFSESSLVVYPTSLA